MKTTSAKTKLFYVAITGNTYPVKEQIKALGGKWNPDEKSWSVPAEHAEKAQSLVPPKPVYNAYTKAKIVTHDEDVITYNNCVCSTLEDQIRDLERMYNRR